MCITCMSIYQLGKGKLVRYYCRASINAYNSFGVYLYYDETNTAFF